MPKVTQRILKPSTRAFFREGKNIPNFRLWEAVHGYIYSRWPYFYISLATGEHRLAKILKPVADFLGRRLNLWSDDAGASFADGYHGKAVPLETAAKLITIGRDIEIRNLDRIVPYNRAKDIILKNPDHIVVLDCPCRASRPDPCLPLDVCLIIGEPFASFIAEHHPEKSRWISPKEAVDILKAEDERGHVHHVFFKEAMLGRFYAVCNCCSCCCGAMQAMRNNVPMLAPSGLLARIDRDLCRICGQCVDTCPFQAMQRQKDRIAIDPARCMGCGVCRAQCPNKAIELVDAKGPVLPLDVDRFPGRDKNENRTSH